MASHKYIERKWNNRTGKYEYIYSRPKNPMASISTYAAETASNAKQELDFTADYISRSRKQNTKNNLSSVAEVGSDARKRQEIFKKYVNKQKQNVNLEIKGAKQSERAQGSGATKRQVDRMNNMSVEKIMKNIDRSTTLAKFYNIRVTSEVNDYYDAATKAMRNKSSKESASIVSELGRKVSQGTDYESEKKYKYVNYPTPPHYHEKKK